MKLNLGCGDNKIEGFINIDANENLKPDLVADFIAGDLPYADGSVDEIVMFHTLEHIEKVYWDILFVKIWHCLSENGSFILSYPEFSKCVENWKTNYKGMKEFWEATIYGRQTSDYDYHVSIVHTLDLINNLSNFGFNDFYWVSEGQEDYNTILSCKKVHKLNYEDWLRSENDRIEIH